MPAFQPHIKPSELGPKHIGKVVEIIQTRRQEGVSDGTDGNDWGTETQHETHRRFTGIFKGIDDTSVYVNHKEVLKRIAFLEDLPPLPLDDTDDIVVHTFG